VSILDTTLLEHAGIKFTPIIYRCISSIKKGGFEVTKTDLINKIAESAGIPQKDAGGTIDAFFGAITEALAKGDKIQIIGFGSFEVRLCAARDGHIPKDPKKVIKIPEKKVPVFKAGKALKVCVL
jgi:DNA-binding protein HU-beta